MERFRNWQLKLPSQFQSQEMQHAETKEEKNRSFKLRSRASHPLMRDRKLDGIGRSAKFRGF